MKLVDVLQWMTKRVKSGRGPSRSEPVDMSAGRRAIVECNVFEIELELTETKRRRLEWRVFTDLPCGALLSYSCCRRYLDHADSNRLWMLDDACVEVSVTDRGDLNGASGALVVDKGDEAGLARFNELAGPYSKGIKTPVSDELQVSFVLGARQSLRAFGKNNANLSGSMVHESGGINVIKVEATVVAPIKAKYQPIDWQARKHRL